MSSTHFGLIDNYTTGQPLSAADLNRRAKVLDTQLSGALGTLGAGVLSGFTVQETSTTDVVISVGEAIGRHSTYGAVYMRQATEFTFTGFTDNAVNYLFASIRTGSGTSPDTRLDGLPLFLVSTGSTLDGAVLLAKVTMASGAIAGVTDLRHWIGETAFMASWFGNGRRIGSNPITGAPVAVPDSLNIKLSAGSKFFYAGRDLILQNDQFIAVPESSTVWPVLAFGDDDEVTATFPTSQPAAGSGSIGKVITGSAAITSINSDGSADLIPDLYALYNLAKTLGGGGDEPVDLTGYVTIAAFNGLVNRVSELENQLNLGTPTARNDYENIHSELAGQLFDLTDVNPEAAVTTPGSLLLDGTTGNSENRPGGGHMPQVSAGGNEPRGDA